jgi:hypothetical protein
MKRNWKSQASLLTKSIIQKGMFPSDIVFTAEEADRFLDYVIEELALLKHTQVIKMKKATKNVRGLGIASGVRVLKPTSKFTGGTTMMAGTDMVQSNTVLSVKKARGCVPVYDDDLEDGVEGDAFADHLLRMVAVAVANELEEAQLLSAPAPTDNDQADILDIWTGIYLWLRSATFLTKTCKRLTMPANRYIASWNDTTKLWEFKFAEMLRWLPNKYKRDPSKLRFFFSPAIQEDYVGVLASRGTVLGDKAILSGDVPLYKGIPIVSVPLIPMDLPVEVSGTHGDTTVDADSAAGQKVLNVTATTNFIAGDTILIGSRSSATKAYKAEVRVIDTIQAGVSLTLLSNLAYTHTAVDAETVKESTADGTFGILTHQNNFITGLRRILKIETERQAAQERTLFYFSLRADFAVENPEAAVLYDDLAQR